MRPARILIGHPTNDYFARLYQVRRATISNWIQQLIGRGHLVTTIDRTKGSRRLLQPVSESLDPSSGLPNTLARITAPPVPPNHTAYPEISFTEMEALLIGKNNDYIEGEKGSTPAPLLEVKVELDSAGAVPPPISRCAPLPMPPLSAATSPGADGYCKCPTPVEVAAYFITLPDISADVTAAEASSFFNYYQTNGWRVGRYAMVDWLAAARNWLLNADMFKTSTATSPLASAAPRLHSGGTKNYQELL